MSNYTITACQSQEVAGREVFISFPDDYSGDIEIFSDVVPRIIRIRSSGPVNSRVTNEILGGQFDVTYLYDFTSKRGQISGGNTSGTVNSGLDIICESQTTFSSLVNFIKNDTTYEVLIGRRITDDFVVVSLTVKRPKSKSLS